MHAGALLHVPSSRATRQGRGDRYATGAPSRTARCGERTCVAHTDLVSSQRSGNCRAVAHRTASRIAATSATPGNAWAFGHWDALHDERDGSADADSAAAGYEVGSLEMTYRMRISPLHNYE